MSSRQRTSTPKPRTAAPKSEAEKKKELEEWIKGLEKKSDKEFSELRREDTRGWPEEKRAAWAKEAIRRRKWYRVAWKAIRAKLPLAVYLISAAVACIAAYKAYEAQNLKLPGFTESTCYAAGSSVFKLLASPFDYLGQAIYTVLFPFIWIADKIYKVLGTLWFILTFIPFMTCRLASFLWHLVWTALMHTPGVLLKYLTSIFGAAYMLVVYGFVAIAAIILATVLYRKAPSVAIPTMIAIAMLMVPQAMGFALLQPLSQLMLCPLEFSSAAAMALKESMKYWIAIYNFSLVEGP
eukprot:gnl/TRDRNA2_/TRDRNA2_83670_c0_seq1.p1 gnl/TRDRNA2_/TRDRNA2_83670_c0~~gnl/TRDRNA2_/TRDRNA2_83670_c0_seq1.p1  ORF type:complete len:295 (+),score=39.33 gnl/TRDRNA2_/TRDRNA2_83670_c0_seq1:77-961(+)